MIDQKAVEAAKRIVDGSHGWEWTHSDAELVAHALLTARDEIVEECAKVADVWERKASKEGDEAPTHGGFIHALSAEAAAHAIAFGIRSLKTGDRRDRSKVMR
jgi:hypothetical protein